MPEKFYLAGPRSRRKMVRRLIYELESRGHECTHDWTTDESWEEGKTKPFVAAELDKMGIKYATTVIACLPGGPGTNFELGYAAALKKRIIVLHIGGDNDLFKPESGNVFYHDPSFEIVDCAHSSWVAQLLSLLSKAKAEPSPMAAARERHVARECQAMRSAEEISGESS